MYRNCNILKITNSSVEHMPKKYRASASLPGSRATSPIHGDKRKRNDQFDINNIEVIFLSELCKLLKSLIKERERLRVTIFNLHFN